MTCYTHGTNHIQLETVRNYMGRGLVAVVDDDAAISDLLIEILTDEGYTVVCAASGGDGLALIRQYRPDVVLLDINLTGIISGLSVAELLRSNTTTADLPIIVSTADSNFLRHQAEVLSALRCDILPKPFEIDQLLGSIEQAIASSRLERTA